MISSLRVNTLFTLNIENNVHEQMVQTKIKEQLDLALQSCLSAGFVCVEVLGPSQPNGVMPSAASLLNHTFTGQAQSSKQLTSIVHILSPETDNCPS